VVECYIEDNPVEDRFLTTAPNKFFSWSFIPQHMVEQLFILKTFLAAPSIDNFIVIEGVPRSSTMEPLALTHSFVRSWHPAGFLFRRFAVNKQATSLIKV